MDKIDCLLLINIAKTGTLTQAAERMGIQKSHASRLLTRLEASLGVRLIERSTRSMRFTEVGHSMLERANTILESMDEAEQFARQYQTEPSGHLRLTCSVEFGQIAASRWINTYLQRYPLMTVTADFSNRLVDINDENFDIAIRVGTLADSQLNARLLGHLHYGLFASPSYLAQHPVVQKVEDLTQHRVLGFTNNQGKLLPWEWSLPTQTRFEPTSQLNINSGFALREAAKSGLGIARLPITLVENELANGTLKQVLPNWTARTIPVHALFVGRRFLSPKLRAFIDLAVALF